MNGLYSKTTVRQTDIERDRQTQTDIDRERDKQRGRKREREEIKTKSKDHGDSLLSAVGQVFICTKFPTLLVYYYSSLHKY